MYIFYIDYVHIFTYSYLLYCHTLPKYCIYSRYNEENAGLVYKTGANVVQ